MGIDIYYTYNSEDYRMPLDDDEDIYWRNIYGKGIYLFSVLQVSDEGYRHPIPGVYRVQFDGDISLYNTQLKACDTLYTRGTSLYDVCVAMVRDSHPVYAIVSCPNLQDSNNRQITGQKIVDLLEDNWNTDLIHGVGLRLTQSPTTIHMFEVAIGCVYIQDEQRYVRVVPNGFQPEGGVSNALRLKVKNNAGHSIEDVKIYLVNKCTVLQDKDGPINQVYQRIGINPMVFDNSDPVNITLANTASGLTDVLIDGYGHDCERTSDGTRYTESKQLSADGSTHYMFSKGTNYAGLCFVLNSGLDGTETATIFTNSTSFWEVKKSTDEAYTKAYDGLDIGTLGISAEFYIDVRANVTSGFDVNYNQVEGLLQIGNDFYQAFLGLGMNIVDTEPPAIIRPSVLHPAMVSKMAEFGITIG
jgi:hypothetical protein